MKKIFFVLVILLDISIGINAVTVSLPDEEALIKRLSTYKEFKHLIENTNLIKYLASKTMEASCVVTAIDNAFTDYFEKIETNIKDEINSLKPDLIKIVLEDFPDAIEEIQQRGHLK